MINFVNLYIYHRKMCMNGSMNAIFQKKKNTLIMITAVQTNYFFLFLAEVGQQCCDQVQSDWKEGL